MLLSEFIKKSRLRISFTGISLIPRIISEENTFRKEREIKQFPDQESSDKCFTDRTIKSYPVRNQVREF
mgnify:CR=1 FL=1